jgi:arginyl-tRNA synthetase
MDATRREVARLIVEAATALGAQVDEETVIRGLAEPPDRALGDLAWPAFALAKALKKAPPAIAAELVAAIEPRLAAHATLGRVVATGPYLNFAHDPARRAASVVGAALDESYGGSNVGAGKTIGIDYSSPNIAKPFGIGHLRSTAIGNALANIYRALGYRVVGVNHLGDWGTQFGKLMSAYERWGDAAALDADPIQHLYDLYVRFHKEVETNAALDDEGRAWFKRLEDGDAKATAYWKQFRDLSLREFQRIYDRLGVSFDRYWGEAYYNDMLDAVVADVEKSGLAVLSEGALVVPLDDLDMPPCLIRKSDGATLYATRDLAAARYRYEQLKFEKFLYVVGTAQSVHFKQVFEVLRRMGYEWADRLEHVGFGMILGISTRKGTLVFLNDILDRGRDLARAIVEEREGIPADEKDVVAEQLAIGAIVFQDLSRGRNKDYEFDWDQMLRGLRPGEPGRTGPYLQYTHVRLSSVEENYRERFGELPAAGGFDANLLAGELERAVVIELERFPAVVQKAADEYEPSEISRYLLDLSAAFNAFYSGGARILSDDAQLSGARIALVTAVRRVLGRGLRMLGVPLPHRM